jgi:hypothetical protein
MEAVRTSEASVDNLFTRQYIPEDNSEQIYLSFILIFLKINIKIKYNLYVHVLETRKMDILMFFKIVLINYFTILL